MIRQGGRLTNGPHGSYLLHELPLHEGDPLDILVGTTWISGQVHYEASDDNWYCDAGPMSIPLSAGREACFRLELVAREIEDDEALLLAALAELGDVYEEGTWDYEGFED